MTTMSTRDPTIEAIVSRRAQFIENVYNKNLRPSNDNLDSENQRNNLPQNEQQLLLSISDNSDNQFTGEQNRVKLEKSTMSRASTRIETTEEKPVDDISDGGVRTYVNACKNLKLVPCSLISKSLPTTVIIVHNYGLGAHGTLALAQALKFNFSVVKLDISDNAIGHLGVKHLIKMFEENSNITDLDISKNNIGTKGVKYLAEIFKKNRFLRDLNLSKNNLTDEDGILLVEAMEDQQFTQLNLSHNGFSEKSGIVLGKWIADNSTLLDLDLSWNHIRQKGAMQIAKGISENNKLIKVNLSWNGFENEGAEALGKALTHNMVLQELRLECNRVGPQGFGKLCSFLKDNNALKRLYIGKNYIEEKVLEGVLKFFQTLPSLALELLDVSEVTLKPKINEAIDECKKTHKNLSVVYGFQNMNDKKTLSPSAEALNFINTFCAQNNISLMDLFSKLDSDGSMAVSYEEFREGLKNAKIPISANQIEALIRHLDKDGDGEIDFSELIIGEEKNRRKDDEE